MNPDNASKNMKFSQRNIAIIKSLKVQQNTSGESGNKQDKQRQMETNNKDDLSHARNVTSVRILHLVGRCIGDIGDESYKGNNFLLQLPK